MKRWTNGLPGATKRLGAKMALRGLSPSESRMRADTHDGSEHNRSTSEMLWGGGEEKAPERLEGLRTPDGEPIPPNTLAELHRDMERRRFVRNQIRQIESARLDRLEQAPGEGAHVMVRLLAHVMGIGIETADMLVQEVLSRNLRDRRAVARYAGLTGSPDESGKKRREKGLARSGNPRVRRGMIQLAWRFLMYQKDSALAQWFRMISAVPPLMVKTAANPGGLPKDVFDGLQAQLAANRNFIAICRRGLSMASTGRIDVVLALPSETVNSCKSVTKMERSGAPQTNAAKCAFAWNGPRSGWPQRPRGPRGLLTGFRQRPPPTL
jgi:hypothetical protein